MWDPSTLAFTYPDSGSIPTTVITYDPPIPEDPVPDPTTPGSTTTAPKPTVTHYTYTTSGTTPPQLVVTSGTSNVTVSCPALNDVLVQVIKWVDVSDTTSRDTLVYGQTTNWANVPSGMKLYEYVPPNPTSQSFNLIITAHMNDNMSTIGGTDGTITETETYVFTTQFTIATGRQNMLDYLAANP